MILADSAPNVWSFLTALAQMLGTAFAVYIGYRATIRNQNPKLDQIHTLVNGNLDKARQEIRQLRTKLEELGHPAE